MKSGYRPWIDNNRILWKKRLGYLYYQFLAMFSDQKKLSSSYDALACSVGLTGWVCEQEAATHPKRLDASIFSECVEYEFENERFVGVRDYDRYLTTLYGDYMQLPPEDQRENRHQIVQIDFGSEDDQ